MCCWRPALWHYGTELSVRLLPLSTLREVDRAVRMVRSCPLHVGLKPTSRRWLTNHKTYQSSRIRSTAQADALIVGFTW